MKNLKKHILKTICFYNIFDYPLTPIEIWQTIETKTELNDIYNELNNIDKNLLSTKHGFYFLKNRESIINTRNERYNHTIRKITRAHKISNLLKHLSSIKLIALGNLIGTHNLKNNSDIDLFIITETGTIWTTRFIATSLMKLLRLRPTKTNQKDKICLSFFITEKSLALNQLKIDKHDHYFTHWLANLYPIYSCNQAYEKLIGANAWLHHQLPNWKPIKTNPKYKIDHQVEFANDIPHPPKFEKRLKSFQINKFPQEIKIQSNQNTNVIINDNVLKFHTNDRRIQYNNSFSDSWNTLKNLYQNS